MLQAHPATTAIHGMKVVRNTEAFRQHYSRCVATIGKFDGVHRGHQAILEQLRREAQNLNLPTVVILIEPHPEEFFARSPEACPPRLSTLDEKLQLLETQGVDCVFQLEFNQSLSQLSPEETIESILVNGLGIAALIVGSDFRFGYRRQGDFALLQSRGKHYGFRVLETASCVVAGERVSSTTVRNHLALGDFARVEALLGRPYSISGEVVRGRQLGTDLGFPTCNINLHRRRIPLHGVFACEVLWGDRILHAAVNIGYRPTVSDSGDALLEAHILDFDADLYGQALSIVFRHKVREELKFPDLATLKRQIGRDVSLIRAYFNS